MKRHHSIAIVGIGGIFPGASTVDEFWNILRQGKNTAREAPPGRWPLPLDSMFDPTKGVVDTVYSKRGCYITDFVFDSEDYPLDSALLSELDPVVHFALYAARNALRDAQLGDVDHQRTGVILGNIALPTEKASAITAEILGKTFEEQILASSSPGTPPTTSQTHPINRHAVGMVAGLIAQAFELGGGTYTIDGACAASLYALHAAVNELEAGRADVMLTGGVCRPDSAFTQMGFSQLRALSPSGVCAPFDEKGDGLVVGEGAGIFVLKRLQDAVRDQDHIYAVIKGFGLSNDRQGTLLAPESDGQVRAMQAAYQHAGWQPYDVDLIECHATGTPVGDVIEFQSLQRLWGDARWQPGQCVIGGVKSNIGHLLTGAGAAGLMKVVLALKHQTLPPMANFSMPAATIDLAQSPFTILSQAKPWTRRTDGTPRRAAVSAFGFGGINAHVLLEEWDAEQSASIETTAVLQRADEPVPVAVVGMETHVGPWASLQAFQERVLGNPAPVQPEARTNTWGVLRSQWLKERGLTNSSCKGYFIDELSLPIGHFRIPPKELQESLPQQLLMLQVAAGALEQSGIELTDELAVRTGVFIGIGLDFNSTNFSYRWRIPAKAREWTEALGLQLDDEERRVWIQSLRDAFCPPLTANRTVGALGGIVASRIAREFHVGGPSFTVSGEENSGLHALEIAMRALQRGDIDQALVGAVDLQGDIRALLTGQDEQAFSPTSELRPFDAQANGTLPGEGAVAILLKRQQDAERDGNTIYATLRGIGSASGGTSASTYRRSLEQAYDDAGIDPAELQYLETHGSGVPAEDRLEAKAIETYFAAKFQERASNPEENTLRLFPASCALGSVKADIGHLGAAAGLASVVKTCVCLYQEIIPSIRTTSSPREEFSQKALPFYFPDSPQYWAHNRAEGPRRAGVSSLSADGNCVHVVLEGYETSDNAVRSTDRRQPLGTRTEALFSVAADDQAGLVEQLQTLQRFAQQSPEGAIEWLARQWWAQHGASERSPRLALALLCRNTPELLEQIGAARKIVTNGTSVTIPGNRIFYTANPVGPSGEVAFVFPGSGNHYPGMGRELSAQWPEILRCQNQQNQHLHNQYVPEILWNTASTENMNHYPREVLLGQVTYSTMMTDLLRSFGLSPQAAIGYSLGESSSLFALNAWTERDEMLRRILESSLYTNDLAGDFLAAARTWNFPEGQAADWLLAAVQLPADTLRQVLKGREKVYLLIINTPASCVIGGDRGAVLDVLKELDCLSSVVSGITAAHCEIVKQVGQSYRALHYFSTTVAPEDIRFYNADWARAYDVTPDNAADAILSQALHVVDFPAVITQAYRDGVRTFIEIGPGNSCAAMIDKILEEQSHLAVSACASTYDDISTVLRLLGKLIAERVSVDLTPLYGQPTRVVAHQPDSALADRKTLRIPTGGQPFQVELPQSPSQPPRREAAQAAGSPAPKVMKTPQSLQTHKVPQEISSPSTPVPPPQMSPQKQEYREQPSRKAADLPESSGNIRELVHQLSSTQTQKTQAHQAYLKFAQGMTETYEQQLTQQMSLLEQFQRQMAEGGQEAAAVEPQCEDARQPQPPQVSVRRQPDTPVFMTREQCMEFAVGSIAKVLGDAFAEADTYPTRVRLPDTPLMLVDRIMSVEGEPRSLTHGRVITEHDIYPDDWYLDCGRIPTCIAVESGQADLFLSGYLGIDFVTKGRAVYRLLDATVTFHGDLPRSGDVIRYDIYIDEFFRQGETYLFRFRFESTVNGELMLTMTNGCAGFFTKKELAEGKGLVFTQMDLRPLPGKTPEDWEPLTEMAVESYSDAQVEALRRGELAACFGPQFADLPLQSPCRLPGGRMKLVDRVLRLDPHGGRYGLGQILGEADIHPDEWFLLCHFVDDQVMPGTLMYECCLHTLRILLMRMGWVAEQHEIAWQPVPGVDGQLKCRGQVIASTKSVQYEISIKEIGYRPEPYVICDAIMSADQKPVVRMTDMSLRLSGTTRDQLRALWSSRKTALSATAASPGYQKKPAVFDSETILAFSNGKPSEAFGDRYRVFDSERVIARLPGPPYQFLDRITSVQGEQWTMVAPKDTEAQYDIPPQEWYFAANRQPVMPFAILLEIVLQPCGWLAAYAGSALTCDIDLSFRNLGGEATQFLPIGPDTGTLTTAVTLTSVSNSGGMIIQHYTYTLTNSAGDCLYQGTTYFGFFTRQALANQIGLRNETPYQPTAEEVSRAEAFAYPQTPPFPDTQLRMVDQIELFVADGGPHGLGFIRGIKHVNPDEWFFKAHFYQDPVWPGSLGLEAFLQLLKVVAVKRWGWQPQDRFETVALNRPHKWTYRGQVIPTDELVTIQASITHIDDSQRMIEADGFLIVDGRIIYQMEHFTLRLI